MNTENILNSMKKFFTGFFALIQKIWNYITNLKLEGLRKIIAVILMVIAGLFIFFDTVLVMLFAFDPMQLEKILSAKFDFNLFDYVSLWEYYAFLIGGYFVEVVFWGLIVVLAIWIYNKNFVLKNMTLRIAFLSVFVSGAAAFMGGIYYALPEVKEPIMQIVQKHKECKADKHQKNMYYRDMAHTLNYGGHKPVKEQTQEDFNREVIQMFFHQNI